MSPLDQADHPKTIADRLLAMCAIGQDLGDDTPPAYVRDYFATMGTMTADVVDTAESLVGALEAKS